MNIRGKKKKQRKKQKKTKKEVITSKKFEVTLFACDFSKLISRSPMNMQVLSIRAILFKHSIEKLSQKSLIGIMGMAINKTNNNFFFLSKVLSIKIDFKHPFRNF